ncbi:starch-binding protein [Butyrivibrio sp. VCB2006]|uniref:starch-binding protein n=1 Tax=Butyrivibrio sp. VCB2006 TaxID=1280679 RepID=UPI0004128709|nr:starch-binding protein [Butyrivibrio sp. VCB2006]
MKRGKLWGRLLSATSLSLSIFLSSFGNVTGVQAMENDNLLIVQEEESTDVLDEETDEAVEAASETSSEEVSVEATKETSVDATEEASEEATEENSATAESETEEYTVKLADVVSATNLAPREQKAADNSLVTRDNIHDGAILHAFCWSFNTIAENMADIADAGYTAVQTSPINECLSTNPGMNLHGPDGMWYYHYQPTDWVIGNYQLGSRDEFKHMCDVADEYGIAIIVDILPNHTTPSLANVSKALKEAAGGEDALYHTTGKTGGGYTDRVELTYYAMGGLYDVDTENAGFQQYFYEFLKDCVYLGADGFRIDTAKHISLPDDPVPSDYADAGRNNFYTNMRDALNEYSEEVGTKSYDDLFVYGEVLQGTNDRLAAYQQYIGGTTASNYGSSIRSALSSGNLSVDRILDYQIYDDTGFGSTYKADTERLVTWVESHDNYMNDSESCWKSIDDDMVIMGWSIIAARDDGTPLFFSRPNNSSKENPYGDNLIGEAGSPIYKAPEVKAVNLFREKMGEANEYLSNPNGLQTIMIERYDDTVEGAVIVNAAQNRTTINAETHLSDGIYPDQVEGSDAVFLVKDGIISGTIAGEGVVVLSEKLEGTGTVVSFYNYENWDSVVARVDNDADTLSTTNENDGWFQVTVLDDEFTIRFENADGSKVSPEYVITQGSGTFVTPESDNLYYSKADAEGSLGINTYSVYFFNTENWDTVYAYGWLDGGEQLFGGWPGAPALNEGSGWWRADVKTTAKVPTFNIIFNNGTGIQTVNIEGISPETEDVFCTVDAENSNGQLVVKRFASKEAAEEALGVSGSFTTAYFYNTEGWDKVCVYTWGATSMGEWPGKELTADEDGWYSVVLPAAASDDMNIIFNNGNNGKQTPDMKVSDMKHRFFLYNGYTYQVYGSKKEALAAIAGAEEVIYTTVYFYNEMAEDANWKNVYLYVFGGENGEYNNLTGAWPGKLMTADEDANWVKAEVPTKALETGTLTYIFNNGNGTQLDDNKNITSDKNYFTFSSRDSFDSKEAVYEFLGINQDEPDEPDEPEQPEQPEQPKTPEGKLTTKWGTTYYVLEDGSKYSGMLEYQGETYYFKENGAMVKSDYVTTEDGKYYFDGNGHMVTGFMTKWGTVYFFQADGKLLTDKIFDYEDGYKYYVNAKGAVIKQNYVTYEGNRYYFDGNGHMVTGFMTKWGTVYYFDELGVQQFDRLVDVDGYTFYLNKNGAVVKSDFVDLEDGRHYFDSEGHMVKGTTITRWFHKYTFDNNGVLIEG